MASKFSLHLPTTLKHLSIHISPFNCKTLCLIVSQLSIPGEREGEENTEQKGAGGTSPKERLSRRSWETKWSHSSIKVGAAASPPFIWSQLGSRSTQGASFQWKARLCFPPRSLPSVPCLPPFLPCPASSRSACPHQRTQALGSSHPAPGTRLQPVCLCVNSE